MKRIHVQLNCGHGRWLHPDSDEAYDVARQGCAQCFKCKDGTYSAVWDRDWERVHTRVFGVNFAECVFVGDDACAHSSAGHAATCQNVNESCPICSTDLVAGRGA